MTTTSARNRFFTAAVLFLVGAGTSQAQQGTASPRPGNRPSAQQQQEQLIEAIRKGGVVRGRFQGNATANALREAARRGLIPPSPSPSRAPVRVAPPAPGRRINEADLIQGNAPPRPAPAVKIPPSSERIPQGIIFGRRGGQ